MEGEPHTMRRRILLTLFAAFWASTGLLRADLLPYPIDTINEQRLYRYEVERSIGLWRISVNFGVSQEEILRWNPALQERGLHFGETILIPVVEQADSKPWTDARPDTLSVAAPVATDTVVHKAVAAKDDSVIVASAVAETDTVPVLDSLSGVVDTIVAAQDTSVLWDDSTAIHLALLLPLQAQNTKRDKNMDRFVDFYEGVLLGLYDLQRDGSHFVLDVYDTEKSATRVRAWLDEGKLDSVDAIIGPSYPMQLMQVSEWAKEHHIPVLAPFTDRVEGIESNPYLLQFNPSEEAESKVLVEWLQEQGGQVNCVLVDAKDADIPSGIRLLRNKIVAAGIPYTTTTIHAILQDSLGTALRDSVENILIFNTDKYANIQVLMPRVLNARGAKRLTLYSRYSWAKENILLPQLYTSIFTTGDTPERAAYEERYQRYFGHAHSSDMPRFDLLGYDLLHEMVAFLRGQKDSTEAVPYTGLQSHAVFERIGEEGGYQNTHITIQHTAE